MTITTQTNKAQATGNGSVKDFVYPFVIQDLSHAQIYLGDVLQSSGYTVNGIGNPSGGSVTFIVAPAAGVLVTILRVVPLTQQVDYSPYDAFPAETHEGALDKLTTITQQMQEELNRSWKVPIDTPPGANVAPPAYEASKVLAWSDTEPNVLVNQPGIDTFTQLHDDAVAAASAAAASQTAAAGYASTSTTQAGIATTQAGIATTKADEAAASAASTGGDAAAADASAQAAAGSASNAISAATSANTSRSAAQAAEVAALGHANMAEKWAQEAEDVPVEPGLYSAYHWAEKAADIVGGGGVASVFGRTGIVQAQVGDYTAAQVTGAVSGPASSVDGQIALFDGVTGNQLKSGPLASDLATDAELTAGLAGKANTVHTHTLSQLTDAGNAASRTVQTGPSDATAGRVLLVGAGAAALGSDVATDAELATKAGLNTAPSFINTVEKFTNKGSVTGTVTINPTVDGGDVQFTMTGNTAVTFTTSGIASGESVVCSVQVLGAFAVTWPAGIFWPTGGIPAYAANSIYTFQLRNFGGTMQIYGFQSGKGMAAV